MGWGGGGGVKQKVLFQVAYNLRALMTSYRLPWQNTRSTKRPSKFQFLKIISKANSVTYRFYFFVGNLFKFFNFLESTTKSYLVEFKIKKGDFLI